MSVSKKDFDSISRSSMTNTVIDATTDKDEREHVDIDNPTLGRRETVTKRAERKGYTKEQVADTVDSMKTRGKKGCGLQRLNIGFKDINVEYLRTMSQITGMSLTEFANSVVDASREANRETFQQAMDIKKQFAPKNKDFRLKGETNRDEE